VRPGIGGANLHTTTQTASITLSAAAGETYNADLTFDRLFGTFRVVKPIKTIGCIATPPGGTLPTLTRPASQT
jgi:hypothetical protein